MQISLKNNAYYANTLFVSLALFCIVRLPNADVIVIKDATKVPQGEIKQVVTDVMAQVRVGDFSGVAGLARRSDEALPHIKDYAIEKNEDVQEAIIEIASFSKSAAAIDLLVSFLTDHSDFIESQAIKALYRYGEQYLLLSKQLPENLITFSLENLDDARPLLLLTHTGSKKNFDFLNEIRAKHGQEKTRILVFPPSPQVKLSFCADIVLSELGDEQAQSRMHGYIMKGDINELVFLFFAAESYNNKILLSDLVNLLKDKRDALETGTYDRRVKRRVSDLALEVLNYKLSGNNVPFPYFWSSKLYSDQDLDNAFQKYKDLLTPK